MKTRSTSLFSLWYALGASLVLAFVGAIWMGVRLTRTSSVVSERPITPETALVRYVPPPLRDTGEAESLIRAIDHSLSYFRQPSPATERRFGNDLVPVSAIIETLEDLKARLQQEGFSPNFFRYLNENYYFYKASAEKGIITGYYEAEVEGSTVADEVYRFPLYAPPPDLVRLREPALSLRVGDPAPERVGRLTPNGEIIPYYSRRDIDVGRMLKGKGLEIVYLKDPIDRFLSIFRALQRLYWKMANGCGWGLRPKMDSPTVQSAECWLSEGYYLLKKYQCSRFVIIFALILKNTTKFLAIMKAMYFFVPFKRVPIAQGLRELVERDPNHVVPTSLCDERNARLWDHQYQEVR